MTKEEIRDKVELWKDRLWLHMWKIDIHYVRFQNEQQEGRATSSAEYLEGCVDFDEIHYPDLKEEGIVHEMVHHVISPLSQPALQHASDGHTDYLRHQMELVVSHVTRILCQAYNVERTWETGVPLKPSFHDESQPPVPRPLESVGKAEDSVGHPAYARSHALWDL